MNIIISEKDRTLEAIDYLISTNIEESFDYYNKFKPNAERSEFDKQYLDRLDTQDANGDQFLSDVNECREELASNDNSGVPLIACLIYGFQAKIFLKAGQTTLAWVATAESCYWCGRMKDRQLFEANASEMPKIALTNNARLGSIAKAEKFKESKEIIKKLILDLKPSNRKWKNPTEAAKTIANHITTNEIKILYKDSHALTKIYEITREFRKDNPTLFEK